MTMEKTEVTVSVPGLKITPEERPAWEKAVAEMALSGDDLLGLDPMDEGPSNIYDPEFSKGE